MTSFLAVDAKLDKVRLNIIAASPSAIVTLNASGLIAGSGNIGSATDALDTSVTTLVAYAGGTDGIHISERDAITLGIDAAANAVAGLETVVAVQAPKGSVDIITNDGTLDPVTMELRPENSTLSKTGTVAETELVRGVPDPHKGVAVALTNASISIAKISNPGNSAYVTSHRISAQQQVRLVAKGTLSDVKLGNDAVVRSESVADQSVVVVAGRDVTLATGASLRVGTEGMVNEGVA
ncbi:MAG: hypothetical protein NT069_18830, partial [Planctomycetota bacterium]|nr:hypothetical protein [Planctomycetota bacterium]